MSRQVQASILARGRRYPGFMYARTLGRIGEVTLTGAEWTEAATGMRLTRIEDGSILGHIGADLRLEIYQGEKGA